MIYQTIYVTQGQRRNYRVVKAPTSDFFKRSTLENVELIATGGMAHIFRAFQPSLGRFVVIKKLKDEFLGNDETMERFRREAKALSTILHQNVAHVYDFVDGSEPFLIMEYIDGIDLSEMIQKLGSIPPVVSACILLGVARGLSYIHHHGLVHRDIKPSNIRVTTDGDVKLMDFGIALDLNLQEGLTRPGILVGSPCYLSPEQVLGDSVTHLSDIFLLGVTFYEMLTGVKAFKDSPGKSVFQKIREGDYIPPRKMNPKIPRAFEKLILKCLKLKPVERFGSVDEIVEHLESFLRERKVTRVSSMLLNFLEEEALISQAPLKKELTTLLKSQPFSDSNIFIKLLKSFMILLSGAFLGFWIGRYYDRRMELPSGYPPPANLQKKIPR